MEKDKSRLRREFFETAKSQPSGEELWTKLLQQKIPDSQKLAFQQLVRELVEQRKNVYKGPATNTATVASRELDESGHWPKSRAGALESKSTLRSRPILSVDDAFIYELWKYVFLFIAIGALAALAVYFLSCWAEFLEVIETKYIIREEIFSSVMHHSLIPWNLTNSVYAPVCLGLSVRRLGEPPSRLLETCARLVTIISLVMFAKGIRLGWRIWHFRQITVNAEELENDPIKVLSETLRKDFLSHIADSGLPF